MNGSSLVDLYFCVTCGDIELNPGPAQCCICHNEVLISDMAEICDSVSHKLCKKITLILMIWLILYIEYLWLIQSYPTI